MLPAGRRPSGDFANIGPNVTLMDLSLPDMSGIEAMIAIRKEFPEAGIVVFTTFEGDMEIRRAFDAGARSYMLKSTPPNDLAETIRQVYAGKKVCRRRWRRALPNT